MDIWCKCRSKKVVPKEEVAPRPPPPPPPRSLFSLISEYCYRAYEFNKKNIFDFVAENTERYRILIRIETEIREKIKTYDKDEKRKKRKIIELFNKASNYIDVLLYPDGIKESKLSIIREPEKPKTLYYHTKVECFTREGFLVETIYLR
jgi:hypothetical protein